MAFRHAGALNYYSNLFRNKSLFSLNSTKNDLQLPGYCKCSSAGPLLRCGDTSGPSNYRPISFVIYFWKKKTSCYNQSISLRMFFFPITNMAFASLSQTLINIVTNIICQALDKKGNAEALALEDVSHTLACWPSSEAERISFRRPNFWFHPTLT